MSSFYYDRQLQNNQAFSQPKQDDTKRTRTIYVGKVVSIDDKSDAMRLTIRIGELDSNVQDQDLPISYPIFPQMIRMIPKVGEGVLVMVPDPIYPHNDRLWVSPMVRQFQSLQKDQNTEGNGFMGVSGYFEKYLKSSVPLQNNPNSIGIIPNPEDVSIIGRYNSDLTLGQNNLRMRVGYFDKQNNQFNLNKTNPGYFFLTQNQETKKTTSVNFADTVLLLTHQGSPKAKSILEDQDLDELIKKAHPLPFGDLLVSLLDLMRTCILNHYHPYPSSKAVQEDWMKKLKEFNFQTLLSKGILIN